MNAFVTFPKYVFFMKWCKNNEIILNRKYDVFYVEFVKSDLNPALKYVEVDHRLVNVEK